MSVRVEDLPNERNRSIAQTWADLGCEVVPWHYDGRRKKPAIKDWQRGAAFRTSEDCAEWWFSHSSDFPGIVTGPTSGVWVLDLDGDVGIASAKALVEAHGPIPPEALRVQTPSGGWHYYFAWHDGIKNTASKVAPGVDVRGRGGYAAAPGAVVGPGRAYSAPQRLDWPPPPAPTWLVGLVLEASRVSGREWDGAYHGDASSAAALATAPPGQQDDALFAYLSAQHRRGVSAHVARDTAWEVVQHWTLSRPGDPWTFKHVQDKVDYIWSRVEYAGIAALAPEHQEFVDLAAVDAARALGYTVELPSPPVPPSVEVQQEAEHRATLVLGTLPEGNHDRANARALALFAERSLRVLGKDIWLVWNGQRWELDEKFKRFSIVEQLAVALLQQATGAVDEERQALIKRSQRLMMVGGRDAALNYARDLLAVTQDELDPDHHVLNCRNGLLDLRTGELRPAEPEDLVTKLVDVDYDPEAKDDVWERVLRELLAEGDRDWLQKWFGYCLTGDTSEKAICCLHGPADSGKSTLMETFRLILGDVQAGGYSTSWEEDVFLSRAQVNRQEKVAGLQNARVVVGSELPEGAHMAAAFVKSITGTEAIASRALYQASTTVTPRLKLTMHTNHLLRTSDQALQKRLRFVYLDRALTHEEKDPRLKKHLEDDPGARRAVLAWAVEGCLRWRMEGLGMPARQEEELAQFRRSSDHLVEFVEEALVATDERARWPTRAQLRGVYDAWCQEAGYQPVKPATFKDGLERQGLVFDRAGNERRWHGVAVSWEPDLSQLSSYVTTESS